MLLRQIPPHGRCPRCKGFLYAGYDKDLCCFTCGEYLYLGTPPAPTPLAVLPPAAPRKRGRPRKVRAVA